MSQVDDDRRGWFVGAGIGSLQLDAEGLSQDLIQYYIQGGWRFNRYFSVDVRMGTSSSNGFEIDGDPEVGLGPAGVELGLASTFGVHARGILPIGEAWELFAQVGYTQAELEVTLDDSYESVSATDSQGSVSWGLGVSWNMTPRITWDLEYQPVLTEGDLWESEAINLAFRYRF
jgi:opacity protein-like surface antigen